MKLDRRRQRDPMGDRSAGTAGDTWLAMGIRRAIPLGAASRSIFDTGVNRVLMMLLVTFPRARRERPLQGNREGQSRSQQKAQKRSQHGGILP